MQTLQLIARYYHKSLKDFPIILSLFLFPLAPQTRSPSPVENYLSMLELKCACVPIKYIFLFLYVYVDHYVNDTSVI